MYNGFNKNFLGEEMKKLSEMTNEELWQLFPIILKEYNEEYKNWYSEEKQNIIYAVGIDNIVRINHIGSTSVDGLIAKPTIDILLEIKVDTDLEQLKASLINTGYIFSSQPDRPKPSMMFLKGYSEQGFLKKVFHLHIRYPGDCDELYFRDYLKEFDDVARQYEKLKLELAKKYKHNRDAYTHAKTEFIKKYTQAAKDRYKDRYKID